MAQSAVMQLTANSNANNNHKIEASYHDESKSVFGCKHYARNCWIKAECCNDWYVCRFCHDEQYEEEHENIHSHSNNKNDNEEQKKMIKPHRIDRYSTKWVKCMQCGTEQQAGKYCIKCKMDTSQNENESQKQKIKQDNDKKQKKDEQNDKYCLAQYYCDICIFYDDKSDKEIFHCGECGLCRIGNKSDFIHCKKCGCCLNYKYYAKHPCIEDSLKSDCPICFTYLFKSRDPVTFFVPCGHPIHYDCLMEYAKMGNDKCPICRTVWYDEDAQNNNKQNENTQNDNCCTHSNQN